MCMHENDKKGIIDSGNRIISELLKKPAFKESLRALLQNIDPDNSPRLVKTIMWQDIEVLLSLASSLPAIANSIIKAADEALVQINEKFPPSLLQGYVKSLVDDIDKDSLARLIRNLKLIIEALSPVFKDAGKELDHKA